MNTLPGYHHRQKPPLGAQLLTGHPLAQGLKCFFPMSEAAGGFASDLAQSAPSQPFVGGSPWGSNGLVYTGATRQYFLAAAQSTLTSAAYLGPLTMAVWCSNANKNTTEINPLCLTYSGNTTPLFQFRLNSGVAGKVDIFGRNNAGTGATAASLANVWNDGKLHLLAAVWTGATLSLYIDGVFQSSAAFSGGVQLDRTCVGVRYYGSSFGSNFVGTISQAAVYNRALTPGEVEQLYDDPYQMVAPPALWRLAAAQASSTLRTLRFDGRLYSFAPRSVREDGKSALTKPQTEARDGKATLTASRTTARDARQSLTAARQARGDGKAALLVVRLSPRDGRAALNAQRQSARDGKSSLTASRPLSADGRASLSLTRRIARDAGLSLAAQWTARLDGRAYTVLSRAVRSDGRLALSSPFVVQTALIDGRLTLTKARGVTAGGRVSLAATRRAVTDGRGTLTYQRRLAMDGRLAPQKTTSAAQDGRLSSRAVRAARADGRVTLYRATSGPRRYYAVVTLPPFRKKR